MIKVSICCITYNHSNYIRKCLDSFLMQQCNFEYEILIHDDASTDGTGNIIKEYAEIYPDIIKPIIQKENQFQKGIKGFNFIYNFPRAKGNYLAICEGDDHWTDQNKLQKQVDVLDNNTNISLCFHNAILQDLFENKQKDFNPPLEKKIFKTKDLILKRWFIPTASIMLRSNIEIPNWRNVNGDLEMLLISSLNGDLYYIDEKMSVYNYGSPYSLSRKSKGNGRTLLYKKKLNLLNHFDKYTNYKYILYSLAARIKILGGYTLSLLR